MEIDGFFRVQRIPPNHLSGKNLESIFKDQLSQKVSFRIELDSVYFLNIKYEKNMVLEL